MKESYGKGVASHTGPESCLDDPRGSGEALTGESAGGLLSSENTATRGPILWFDGEGNTGGRENREWPTALAEPENLACVDILRARIGIPREGVCNGK